DPDRQYFHCRGWHTGAYCPGPACRAREFTVRVTYDGRAYQCGTGRRFCLASQCEPIQLCAASASVPGCAGLPTRALWEGNGARTCRTDHTAFAAATRQSLRGFPGSYATLDLAVVS